MFVSFMHMAIVIYNISVSF